MSNFLGVGEVDIEDANYLTVVNIMTYKDDGDILYWSLRALFSVFKGAPLEVYVMDDASNPMTDEMRESIIGLDPRIRYEVTTFERNRNLNGRTCVKGMLRKFVEHEAGRECLNIKMDPDTVLTRKRLMHEFWNFKNTAYCASNRPGCYFSGVMYMWKSGVAERALRLIESDMLDNMPDNRGPEDYTIGILLSVASLPRLSTVIRAWDNDAKKGFSAAWSYAPSMNDETKRRRMVSYMRLYDFITMGNWFIHRKDGVTKADRVEPTRFFAEAVEARFGIGAAGACTDVQPKGGAALVPAEYPKAVKDNPVVSSSKATVKRKRKE